MLTSDARQRGREYLKSCSEAHATGPRFSRGRLNAAICFLMVSTDETLSPLTSSVTSSAARKQQEVLEMSTLLKVRLRDMAEKLISQQLFGFFFDFITIHVITSFRP